MDGLRIVIERETGGPWLLSVDGMLKFGPEFLRESNIADVKAEAIAHVDRVLLNLRVAVGDVTR